MPGEVLGQDRARAGLPVRRSNSRSPGLYIRASVAGVVTFLILPVHAPGSVAPDRPTGIALGVDGLAGGYTGARIQQYLPDVLYGALWAF